MKCRASLTLLARNHPEERLLEAAEVTEHQAPPTGVGGRLVARGLLSERDLERARIAKREMGCMLGEALVRLGLVAESNLVAVLCEELDVAFVAKEGYPEEPVILESLPEQFLLNNAVVPLSDSEDAVVFAALKPQDPFIKKALHLATGKRIELRLGLAADIEAAFGALYAKDEEEGELRCF